MPHKPGHLGFEVQGSGPSFEEGYPNCVKQASSSRA